MRHLLLLSIVFFVPFQTAIAEEPPIATSENLACLTQESTEAVASDLQTAEPNFVMGACSATADCGVHGNLTCNGNSTCSFVDRNCFLTAPPESGYVICDGVKTNCPSNSSCESGCFDEYWECLQDPNGSLIECREDRAACICHC